MPRAIIVGATGQDGTYLYRQLTEMQYQVLGIGRHRVITNQENWADITVPDIKCFEDVADLVKKIQPDEIYHLAAVHQSSEDPIPDHVVLFSESYEVNVVSLFNFLEAIRKYSHQTRIFYAASSHIFGRPENEPQDENTQIDPMNIYAVTKVSGLHLCRMYRTVHYIFASVGILYNHESPLRGKQFVSTKITQAAVRCKKDPTHRLHLGNLKSKVDWGYAPDYVNAMHRIMKLPESDDFIIATGEKHTVEEFARIAFDTLGLDWRNFVVERKEVITRPAVALIGNPDKLIRKTGWKRTLSFSDMVQFLTKNVEADHG